MTVLVYFIHHTKTNQNTIVVTEKEFTIVDSHYVFENGLNFNSLTTGGFWAFSEKLVAVEDVEINRAECLFGGNND